jgi:hypothetical protein
MLSVLNANRWYKLKPLPVQLDLVQDEVRFKVVPAGRRSGKTERAKRFIIKTALKNEQEAYFVAAPTRDQVKKIYWTDLKRLAPESQVVKFSETELAIYFTNGTTITLIGLDKPERIEGTFWSGGIIDEIADIKPDAWEAHIRPALDTYNPSRPDYLAWCWLIGVPDGLNHYYDMYQYAMTANDPDWKGYHWKSSDILPEKTIIAAKRQMSAKQYKQEYEASFETATGRIYEDYSEDNHTDETIKEHEQLLWMHDFNYTPMSSAVGVVRWENGKENIYILDEIVLQSAITTQSTVEFLDKYEDHKNKHVIIYGDPAGRAGEKHGHESDYTQIEDTLREHGWSYERRVTPAAPAIKDRQNALRAKIKNQYHEVSLFVNPSKAPYANKGLATVQTKKGSTFQEVETEYQHITTAIGYFVAYDYPIIAPVTQSKIVGF